MNSNPSRKICPVCKNENIDSASICVHCGTSLEEFPTRLVAVPDQPERDTNASTLKAESFVDVKLIPSDGIGVYVAGESKPLYVSIPNEIVIGRAREGDTATETYLDLTDLHAGAMGVSRRHALIRRTESGFDVIDLLSRNGTWLNAERLVPHKPYPLPGESQLRIGNMRLLIKHRSDT